MRSLMPKGISAALVIALLSAAGCSTSPSVIYMGTVTDPAGDTTAQADVATSPDLVKATIEVSGTNLIITVTFAAGTLSQAKTQWVAVLDTDENPATGFPGIDSGHHDSNLIGFDFEVDAVNAEGSMQATIYSIVGSTVTKVGTVPVEFPSATVSKVTIPLSLLGNDDGRLAFKIESSQILSGTSLSGALDYMPNIGLAPGLVR